MKNSKLFSSYSPCARNKKFRIANGTLHAIARRSIPFSPLITLHNVPNLSCNLLAIKWKEAVLEEIMALEKNQTWQLVELPKRKSIVGCKWIFTIGYKFGGSIERYKAWFVDKGLIEIYRTNYYETFTPVVKLNTIKSFYLVLLIWIGHCISWV
ncbi:putative mitochondrial protein, partial [Mucuna pruriens]